MNQIETNMLRLQYDMTQTINKHEGELKEKLRELMSTCLLSLCDAINTLMLKPEDVNAPIEKMIGLLMGINLVDFEDQAEEIIQKHKEDMETLTVRQSNIDLLERCLVLDVQS